MSSVAIPFSRSEAVIDILHGVAVTDPHRWLEDQNSVETRAWLEAQTIYARTYLDNLPGRCRIRERIREFLTVESVDSPKLFGSFAYYRRRPADDEQAAIYVRNLDTSVEELLIDPSECGDGTHTSIHPVRLSPDGTLLLYEIKQGGERSGEFALFDIANRQTLADKLPRGFLRGFAFDPAGLSFYYVHEPLENARPFYRAAFQHVLGTAFQEDREVFRAGEDQKLRLYIVSSDALLGFFVCRYRNSTLSSLFVRPYQSQNSPAQWLADFPHYFVPRLDGSRVLALTDFRAPNYRIVEIAGPADSEPAISEIIPETDARINRWFVTKDYIVVSYVRGSETHVGIFTPSGAQVSDLPVETDQTVRLVGVSRDRNEIFAEAESFTQPIEVFRCSLATGTRTSWASRKVPFDPEPYIHKQVSYLSKDGTRIPMSLVGRKEVLLGKENPAILTGYGGYGVPMTPQFSVFVAFLLEHGCLFALPNLRGGSEFGAAWHDAARRRNRQTACDDLLSAADWLISEGLVASRKLAVFGGSNSGLLAAAALTERPELFCAAVVMAPLTDMLRYHLVDSAFVWKDEFGTAEDPADFATLLQFSPYHRIRDGMAYPPTLVVSGDADGNCNPFHARKFTARLQLANASAHPILLDYRTERGHSAVLPLSDRVEALTDRMAFLCFQLGVSL
jgi:prolyl oligopeptidase